MHLLTTKPRGSFIWKYWIAILPALALFSSVHLSLARIILKLAASLFQP
jgi:hypothetical protein